MLLAARQILQEHMQEGLTAVLLGQLPLVSQLPASLLRFTHFMPMTLFRSMLSAKPPEPSLRNKEDA
jgi:hypothetical protein